jgi:hypothetical protein
MKKTSKKHVDTDELRPGYDLTKLRGWVRGKYLRRYRAGTNLVLLSPDVAVHFPDAQSVNRALRELIHAREGPRQPAHRSGLNLRGRRAAKSGSGPGNGALVRAVRS